MYNYAESLDLMPVSIAATFLFYPNNCEFIPRSLRYL